MVIASEGDYKLKLKFLRSDRKTPYEINVPLHVVVSKVIKQKKIEINKSSNKYHKNTTKYSDGFSKVTGMVVAGKRILSTSNISRNKAGTVFRSSTAKARSIAVYFLIALLTIVLIALILKRF